MDLREIIEFMTLEHVLEGLGLVFGVGLLWNFFFNGGINTLLEILLSVT